MIWREQIALPNPPAAMAYVLKSLDKDFDNPPMPYSYGSTVRFSANLNWFCPARERPPSVRSSAVRRQLRHIRRGLVFGENLNIRRVSLWKWLPGPTMLF